MGETTGIAWCDSTFNTHWGCQRVSPGCENCYAEQFATKRMGLPIWGGSNTARRFFGDAHWAEPLKWDRKAKKSGLVHRVFCGSMMDYAEDRRDLDPTRRQLARLVEETPHLTWLLLTKRPQNAVRLMSAAGWTGAWPLNVWALTTAEDQPHAHERIPFLLRIPAAVHGVSYEPALGPVDFTRIGDIDAMRGIEWRGGYREGAGLTCNRIDWVIVGGESGAGARPFDLAWARDVVSQCRAAGVAPFVKQMGARPYDSNVNMGDYEPDQLLSDRTREPPAGVTGAACVGLKLKDSHGGDWEEWPSDIRVREFPKGATNVL